VLYQTWRWLAFLHRSYPPAVVQRLLPPSLRVHDLDGRAWVGLTPFLMEDVRTPLAPAPPWSASFPETNVRTYVVGPDGREGLWFLSLDAARLEPVLVAAAGLPDPEGAPVVHWSPGVRTRIGGLRPLGRA
jgi:uncharacterized protein YqjF (DUF2071 family)